MLFVKSLTAERFVEQTSRLALLDALKARGHAPLIRSARLYCFEQALAGEERAGELERAVAEWQDAEGDDPYVRGELFCADDHAFFLIFSGLDELNAPQLRAGLVYTTETAEPAQKLAAFCRDVREAVESITRPRADDDFYGAERPAFEWRPRGAAREGENSWRASDFSALTLDAVEAAQAAPPVAVAQAPRVAELLENAAARAFLLRLSEAQAGGRAGELFPPHAADTEHESLVAHLAGAGLVRREVQVSCRKDGRSLFRLPSVEALGIVTASNAVCSECGLAIADERAEELLTPTPLAASMLKGGAWLVNRVRAVLESLGLPATDVSARPDDASQAEEGLAQLIASVCGEQFLFVLKDGDFTGAQARRAVEAEAETQAARLVVVSTGKIHDDARARLREFTRRRARAGGGETEVHFIEGVEHAAGELAGMFERVTRQALARGLFELDASAGFNVGHMLATRFSLTAHAVHLEDLAASAAGALAGNFGES
jgi:hypothetical protein